MAGLAFEHVTKVFPDGTAAVEDLDLLIYEGEFFVLVGPSGCGKSTALRLVGGLEDVTRGTLRVGDRVVNDLPPGERGVAMVFEGSALYPHLDVAGNIGFPLQVGGEHAARRSDRVGGVAGRLGLGGLLGRRPSELSEGERRRTALGRAVVRRPEVFLMDEPLSNLDAGFRMKMRGALARLRDEQGTTVLYVTHDQAEAMVLGDRVAVMRDGHVEQVDEPLVLYERPVTLFVATFVGSPPMNLWHVRLAEEDGRVVVLAGGRRLAVPPAVLDQRPALRGRIGRDLVLGLRPESLTRAGSHPIGTVLELPVALVEALGSHLLVRVEAEGAGMQLGHEDDDAVLYARPTSTLVARLPPFPPVRRGERLRLLVDLEHAHFFDPVSQRAIR